MKKKVSLKKQTKRKTKRKNKKETIILEGELKGKSLVFKGKKVGENANGVPRYDFLLVVPPRYDDGRPEGYYDEIGDEPL